MLITDVAKGSPAAKAGLKAGGEQVELKVSHNGKTRQLKIKIGKPQVLAATEHTLHPLLEGAQLNDSPDGHGVQVANLALNSRAACSGLRAGDIILAANKQRVYNLESLRRALQRSASSVLLQINRNGSSLFIASRGASYGARKEA